MNYQDRLLVNSKKEHEEGVGEIINSPESLIDYIKQPNLAIAEMQNDTLSNLSDDPPLWGSFA